MKLEKHKVIYILPEGEEDNGQSMKHFKTVKDVYVLTEDEFNNLAGKDFIIDGITEGSKMWQSEYDNCLAILKELVHLKIIKDSNGKNDAYYLNRQPQVWAMAKKFIEKYQHH